MLRDGPDIMPMMLELQWLCNIFVFRSYLLGVMNEGFVTSVLGQYLHECQV